MKQITWQEVEAGQHLRVYLDPGNTDLDYVDGTVAVLGDSKFLRVEQDHWIEAASDLTGRDLRLTKTFAQSYRYFLLEAE